MKIRLLSLCVALSVVVVGDVFAGSNDDQSTLSVTVEFDRSAFDVWQDCALTVTLTNTGTSDVLIPVSPNAVRSEIDAAPKQLQLALVVSTDDARHQVHGAMFYGSAQLPGSIVTLAPGAHVTLETVAKWGLQPEFAAALLSQGPRSFNASVDVSQSTDGTSWSAAVSSSPRTVELKLPH